MLFKTIVIFFISMYSVSITTESVFARNNRKKKSGHKKTSRRKSRSQSSARYTEKVQNTNNNTTIAETKENNQTNNVVNNNTQTQQNTTSTIETQKQEVKQENKEPEEIKSDPNDKPAADISKDPKWEEFRLCMQQGCSGGDDQPNNVECYKAVNFDKQFTSCKPLIAENKRSEFKKYFLNTFIPNEKKEFCENKEGSLQGKFENDTCKITIRFKRNGHKNECLSTCDKIERTKTISINKAFTCSPDFFGVSPCYKDSPSCQAAKIKKITGGIQIAGGIVSGVVAGVSAGFSAAKSSKEPEKAKEPEKTESSTSETQSQPAQNTTTTSNTTEEKKSGYNHLAATMTGIEAGMDGVAKGTGELVSASFLEKEKGEMLKGNCIFPDGSAVGEGMTKKISW